MPSFLSVVVCTYNREKYIGRCLQHLAKQESEVSTYEVIIVDNNSTDNTNQICTSFVSQHAHFKYFLETNQGHSFSRNRGIQESSGDIIAFLDDDAFVTSDYVSNLINFFSENHQAQAIGGKIDPIYEGGEPNWMTPFLLPLVAAQDMGENIKPFKGRAFPIGANMAFRKEVFKNYGLFNIELGRKGSGLEGGDEKEVFLRLKSDNLPIFYVPSVKVEHIIPEKRVTREYIKGLALGVGTSERKRIRNGGIPLLLQKILEETIKIGGTIILFIYYMVVGKFSSGLMLIKFRYWVLKGLLLKR